MTEYTENINLLKKDPIADGNDTFNIKTMLNDNWDKIDEYVVPVKKGGTGATTAANARTNLGACSTATYTVSVTDTWTADSVSGGYSQTVAVSGILKTDNPIADVVLGNDADANYLYSEAWARIVRIVAGDGTVTFYSKKSVPKTAFSVQLKVVR